MIVAIDGPAGSGKSTVARRVAQRLGFHYLDTGAMYRAIALHALTCDVPAEDEEAVVRIARTRPVTFAEDEAGTPTRVFIAGRDVTEAIRTPRVDDAVSAVARMPHVREALVEQQRAFAASRDIVVEGRDIGTVVFPDADVKVFLTASTAERARRRAAQQAETGETVDADGVHAAISRRDELDSSRTHSPLQPADDAIALDSTGLTIAEVVERIACLAEGQVR